MNDFNAEMVLNGYFQGVFPMAEKDGNIYWYRPELRAIIPIDSYKPHKSLRPVINQRVFEVRFNTEFEKVIRNCAKPRYEGDGVWISEKIIDVYCQLSKYGFAHSVEAWKDDKLAGGLYGVALGNIFFGESMYHEVSDASKIAFHYLVQRLRERGFKLLDTQFMNDNVKRFGAIEISRAEFEEILSKNLSLETKFHP